MTGKNVAPQKYTSSKGRSLLSVAVIVLCATTAAAQRPTDKCRPAPVIPLASEPPAKIFIDPPLAEPLASRGVVVINYCAENLRFVPVFGPGALTASPRVGHLHVTVDDASWVWMDASGNPIILMGLSPGPHKVLIELQDANHHTLDKGTVKFVVPEKAAAEKAVLPKRSSERQQSGGSSSRRRPLHGGRPSGSSQMTPFEWSCCVSTATAR